MITVIVVPTNPEEPLRLQQVHTSDVDAYRRLVGGGLELVSFRHPEAGMYLHDEGKLLDLPFNDRATTLLWVHNSAFRDEDVIVGPAFIVGPADAEGDDTSAPEDLVNLLFHTKRYRVELSTNGESRWNDSGETFTDWLAAYRFGIDCAHDWAYVDHVRVVPHLDDTLRDVWFRIGMEIPDVARATDPPFRKDASFVGCYSAAELEERIGEVMWATGTALYYRDLCFIKLSGGDAWMAIRHGIAFERVTVEPLVEDRTFIPLVRRMLAATKEQCQRLTY